MAKEITLRVGRQRVAVEQTLLDRAITYVAPIWGAQRLRARFGHAMLSGGGGYSGTPKKKRSLSEWNPSAGDANADLLPDLPALREASRDLDRNTPLAAGIIKTKITNIIGAGFRLNATIDRDVLGISEERAQAIERDFEREWRLWANSKDCDIERTSTFSEQTRIVFGARLISGDVLALLPFVEREPLPYGLKVQVIEGDRLSNPSWAPDNEKLAGGVESDENGAPIAYHIADRHPGSRSATKTKWERRAAFDAFGRRVVLHIYDKRRPGQSRGVPDLAAVIEPLKQLDRYTEAEVAAAVVTSMFTVFVKTDTGEGLGPMEPTAETGGKSSDKDFKLGNAAILDLAPGESIETANPNRPNTAYDPFVQSVFRQIGVAVELPFEILIKHFTASYSAARAAIVEAWKYYLTERAFLRDQWLQPVYEALITEAVARGRVAAPGFLKGDAIVRQAYLGARWVGPGRGQIDEKKEVEAAILRIEHNLSTKADETAAINGGEYEANLRQRSREIAAEAGMAAPASIAPGGDDDETDPDLPDTPDQS